MKKMLILALIGLFYIATSALVPPQTVPVDIDVGICYVLPTDQASDMVMYIAENNTLSVLDYRVDAYSGVEKPDGIIYNDEEKFQSTIYTAIQNFDYKPGILSGFRNQIDKYPFASDLGLRKS